MFVKSFHNVANKTDFLCLHRSVARQATQRLGIEYEKINYWSISSIPVAKAYCAILNIEDGDLS